MDKIKIYLIEVLRFSLLLLLITFSLVTSNYKEFIDSEVKEDIVDKGVTSTITSKNYKNGIEELKRDLLFLYHTDIIKNFIDKPSSIVSLRDITSSLILGNPKYSQIRLLDSSGYEVYNLTYKNKKFSLNSKLEDKSDRYYFKELQNFSIGEVYLSHIDLSIEDGAIEFPYVPTIRTAIPILNSKGERYYIVINYLVGPTLEEVVHGGRFYIGMIVDDKGYWIKNEMNPNTQWGRYLTNRRDKKFSISFPNVWNQIKGRSKGLIKNKQGIFLFRSLVLGSHDRYYSIYYIPNGYNLFLREKYISIYHSGLIKWGLFSLLLSIFIGNFAASSKIYRQKLYLEATRDPMTGVYNRRYILQKLDTMVAYNTNSFSVAYIDINGLKKVNDNYGHDEGDYLIKLVCETLLGRVRKTDIIGRIGGDEFIILFPNTSKGQVEDILSRVNSSTINIRVGIFPVSFSFGIEEITGNLRSREEILQNIDTLMYQMKKTT